MNDVFEYKVRSAAIAGWWTSLAFAGVLTLQYFAYLYAVSAHPAALWLTLWAKRLRSSV